MFSPPFLRRILPLLLMFVIVAHAGEAERRQLVLKLREVAQDIANVQDQLSKTRGALGKTERKLARLNRQYQQTNRDITTVRQQLSELEAEHRKLLNQQTAYREDVQAQLDSVSQQLQQRHRQGSNSNLQLLLNQTDPDSVQRLLVWHGYLAQYQHRVIDDLRASIAKLNENAARIDANQQAVAEREKQLSTQLAQLQEAQQARERTARILRAAQQQQETRLASLKTDQSQLQSLLDSLNAVLSDIPDQLPNQRGFASLRKELRWPIQGKLTSPFGKTASGEFHNGVFISAPMRQGVHGIAAGRVAFADYLRGYGLLLIIDHGDGYMSLYGHNQSLYKSVGDWVQEGDLVAVNGNSGARESTGLHFEIRHHGKPLNPQQWCFGEPKTHGWQVSTR